MVFFLWKYIYNISGVVSACYGSEDDGDGGGEKKKSSKSCLIYQNLRSIGGNIRPQKSA